MESQKFDRMFTIVVPKYSNAGERISTETLAEYAKVVSREFGGATVHPSVLGCWVDERTDELVCEENLLIETAVDTDKVTEAELEEKREFVRKLARKIGEDLGQYAVMAYEDVIDRLSFVEGDYKEHIPESMKEEDFFKKLID